MASIDFLIPDQPVFTTGQIRKLLHVSMRTVTIWFDRGLLSGFHVPGVPGLKPKCRRISRESLVEFVRENGMEVLLESDERYGASPEIHPVDDPLLFIGPHKKNARRQSLEVEVST